MGQLNVPLTRRTLLGGAAGLALTRGAFAQVRRSTVDDPALEAEERRAKARNVGLWIDKDPQPPWEWRASLEQRRKAGQSVPVVPAPQP